MIQVLETGNPKSKHVISYHPSTGNPESESKTLYDQVLQKEKVRV